MAKKFIDHLEETLGAGLQQELRAQLEDHLDLPPKNQLLLEHKPIIGEAEFNEDDVDYVDWAETMTLDQCDTEKRFGRVIIQWGLVKDEAVIQMGMMMKAFFPVDIHLMGEDAYCFLGFSPLFRSLASDVKDMKMEEVPFYQIRQVEGTGDIVVEEMKIEKNIIQRPTAEQIKKLG